MNPPDPLLPRSPQSDAIRQVYGELAPDYETLFPALHQYGSRVEDFLEDALKPGARVLDVGCGPGLHTRSLPPDMDVVGLDLSPQMLELARQARPSGTWRPHDYHQPIPPELGRFDVALAVGCLDFCEDLPRVMRHFAAALAPKGRMLLTVLERRPGLEGHEAPTHFIPTEEGEGPDATLHFWSFEETSRAITDTGLLPRAYVHAPGWVLFSEQRTMYFGWWDVERR